MVMSSQEERSKQTNLENRDILVPRPSSIITAPCSGKVDVEHTSSGCQVQNMYSWNKAGSPDRPGHIGPHRASLPKPENVICSIQSSLFLCSNPLALCKWGYFLSTYLTIIETHLHKNSNLNHIVLRGLALPGNGAVAHRGPERG